MISECKRQVYLHCGMTPLMFIAWLVTLLPDLAYMDNIQQVELLRGK